MKKGNFMDARYWNQPVDDKNKLSMGIRIAFDDDICKTVKRFKNKPSLSNDIIMADLLKTVQSVTRESSLKLKLQITAANICLIKNRPKTGWTLLGEHPGGLYRIYVSNAAKQQLSNPQREAPLTRTARPFPTKEAAKKANESMNQTKQESDPGDTVTQVTKSSIQTARRQTRGITQNHVMHNKGQGAGANNVSPKLLILSLDHSPANCLDAHRSR